MAEHICGNDVICEDIAGYSGADEAAYIGMLNACSLLIIDDLGAERNTDYALEKVYNVIDSRVRADKPMILTTNLTFDEMMRIGYPLSENLRQNFLNIVFRWRFRGSRSES